MGSGQLVEYADNISQSDSVVADAKKQLKVREDAAYGTHDLTKKLLPQSTTFEPKTIGL
jgi:hypothetical protein